MDWRPYDARVVANTLLKLAADDGRVLTHMQLQKLLSIAHGWHLALTGAPLLDERIEAWEHGPVVREVYDEFKEFGRAPIGSYYTTLNPATALSFIPYVDHPVSRSVLQEVWNAYRPYPAAALRQMTHAPGTPWAEVYGDGAGNGAVIDDDVIRAHYLALARRRGVEIPDVSPSRP